MINADKIVNISVQETSLKVAKKDKQNLDLDYGWAIWEKYHIRIGLGKITILSHFLFMLLFFCHYKTIFAITEP